MGDDDAEDLRAVLGQAAALHVEAGREHVAAAVEFARAEVQAELRVAAAQAAEQAATAEATQALEHLAVLAGSDEPADAIRLLDLFKQTDGARQQQQSALDAAAALPGRRSSQGAKQVDPSKMSKDEYWVYLDQLDRQQKA